MFSTKSGNGVAVVSSKGDEVEVEDTLCGVGPCKPQCIQPCASLTAFTGIFSLLATLMNTMSSLLSSQITSLEKQFNFSSTVSGMLLTSHQIGYLAVLLFISHFGKHSHIPRLLGVTGLLFGLTAIVTSMSYFIQPVDLPTHADNVNETSHYESRYMCNPNNTSKSDSAPPSIEAGGSSASLWLIGIAMALYGASTSPRNTLAGVYIDNNVKDKSKSATLMGAVFSAMVFGPSLALLTGGAFAKLPVDLKDTYLKPSDPRWIGAWWLGFTVFGCVGILLSIPLFCIPRRIPGSPKSDIPITTTLGKVKDLPLSVIRVLRRPVYAISVLNSILLGFAISGLISFGPKYLEYQFNIAAYKASLILGISYVVTSAVGTFIGGMVTGKLKLSRQGCIKFIMITHVISLGFNALALVFGCENTPIEGLDFNRNDSIQKADCMCDETPFLPVCGDDHVTYSSPCQAGCWNQTGNVYTSCSRVGGMSVTPGICDNGCKFLIPYIIAMGITGLTATLGIMPHVMVYLRSVEERDKAMALGIFNFISTLLGWMPAPIVYGKVIDTACKILRHTSSRSFGACSHYDIVDLRYKTYGMEVALKVLAFVLLVISLVVCRWEDSKNGMKDSNIIPNKVAKADEMYVLNGVKTDRSVNGVTRTAKRVGKYRRQDYQLKHKSLFVSHAI